MIASIDLSGMSCINSRQSPLYNLFTSVLQSPPNHIITTFSMHIIN